jgi:hypothetical protein
VDASLTIQGICLTRVKTLVQNSSVTDVETFWSAETAQYALDATRELERMAVLEEIAEQHDAELSHLLRAQYALRYRELLAIQPGDRDEYRTALERIAAGGGMSIEDLRDHFIHRQ